MKTHSKKAQIISQVSMLVLFFGLLAYDGLTQKNDDLETLLLQSDDLMFIQENQKIILAAVADNSIIYTDGLKHGFGYDVARQYAKHLGAKVELVIYNDADDALTALKNGSASLALINQTQQTLQGFNSQPLACDDLRTDLGQSGISQNLSFITTEQQANLQADLAQFLCQADTKYNIKYLAKFHNNTLFDNDYNRHHFFNSLKKLPLFEHSFKANAQTFEHDWQLLAMIGYQESRFDAQAVSPTGVQGMMMLTQNTAQAMGVQDRNDANQSIYGGAKYLNQLKDKFAHIPEEDRLWFVLAAYNMGPYAVKNIQAEIKNQGKDENDWLNFYIYLSEHASQNSRYRQCLNYVTNIRHYLEAIKK